MSCCRGASRRARKGVTGGGRGKDGNGRYPVCVSGNSQSFGATSGRKPDGIVVSASGKCTFMEWAGGFDGFWSIDAGDGHEDGLALAVKQVRLYGCRPCIVCCSPVVGMACRQLRRLYRLPVAQLLV